MLWLHHDVFRIYCGSRIFSIAFIVILSRCTVLAFRGNCNNPRLVRNYRLLVVIRHLEYYLGGEYMILYEILVTTLYFPFVVPRYHLEPLLELILQIIWMNYQGPGTWTRWIPGTFLGNRHHICVVIDTTFVFP